MSDTNMYIHEYQDMDGLLDDATHHELDVQDVQTDGEYWTLYCMSKDGRPYQVIFEQNTMDLIVKRMSE